MSAFHAFYSSGGKATNLAEEGGTVALVFTDPPQNATDVVVSVMEAAEGKKEAKERELVSFSGLFRGGTFSLTSFKVVSQGATDPVRKPAITIAFGGVSNTVDLPVDKEENGRFNLRLDVKGVVDGKKISEKNIALLHVTFKRDVLVIPAQDGKVEKALAIIRTWATQWRDRAPATRALAALKVDSKPIDSKVAKSDFDDFQSVMLEAGRQAHGGAIILSVGHGDDGTSSPGNPGTNLVAWTNLICEDRTHDAEGFFEYRLDISETDLNEGAGKGPVKITPKRTVNLNALSELGDKLNALDPKPEEIRFHTCNVGLNTTFCQSLADRLQIPVRAQKDFVEYEGFAHVHPMFAFYGSESKKARLESEKTELPASKLTAFFKPGAPPPRFP